jgi:cell division protein FtsW
MSRFDAPRLILATGILLAALGVVVVYSATAVESGADGSTVLRALPQLLWAAMAVSTILAVSRLPVRLLGAIGVLAGPVATALLLLPFLPGLGVEVGGSPRWIALPAPLPAVHPAEFAKPLLVLALASSLVGAGESIGRPRSILVLARIALLPLGIIIAAPDLGTGAVVAAIAVGLYWLAGGSLRAIGATVGAIVVGAVGVLLVTPYQQARIDAWLDPTRDPSGASYQILRAREAFAEGGLFGLGPGGGAGLITRVPNAHNDFALAVVGIDWGLPGTLLVLFALGLLGLLSVRVATRAGSRFEALIAAGAGGWVALQGLLNAGAVLGVLPVTGVPIPLLSAGGSSALAAGASLGLLLGVARRSELVPRRVVGRR